MDDFECDWCGAVTGVRVVLVTKVEMFDPFSGQDLLRHSTEHGFCTPRCRLAWIREP